MSGSVGTRPGVQALFGTAKVSPVIRGIDGITPHIGDNGNWFIGNDDTGVKAVAVDGNSGITPHIGDNGNWFIGDTDTGVRAAAIDGTDGTDGKNGEDGYSPTIDVTEIEEGYILTINDANGIKTVTILHGASGDFTTEDIKSAVDDYLAENPAGGSHPVVDF